jgi:hypothetical protein
MAFVFGTAMITIEIPALLEKKFSLTIQGLGLQYISLVIGSLTIQGLGLQYISLVIGSLLGEQVGGSLSDAWMNSRARHCHHRPPPEYRLWLSYVGFILAIGGVTVFLVQAQNSLEGEWNVTPVVGAAIAAFGNQVVTTVLITYAVDCNPDNSASVGVFINFVRQERAFIGPFW